MLKKTKSRNNPVPHFFGLLVGDERSGCGLNKKGLQAKEKLCHRVNKAHVHLYEAHAERKEEKSIVLRIRPGMRWAGLTIKGNKT